jgi:hypothetical protein
LLTLKKLIKDRISKPSICQFTRNP